MLLMNDLDSNNLPNTQMILIDEFDSAGMRLQHHRLYLHLNAQFRRTSLTRFPAQSVRSSNAYALDSPYLLVLSTRTFQSRQYELLSNDTPPILENESSNFDHHYDPSFPRPPPKPLDVEIFFESDSGVLTTNVVKGISEHDVLMPNIFPTLPTFDLLYLVYDTLLSFSSENEDKVFKPSILSYLLVSHRDKTTFDFSKNPMMMYGGDIPLLDVPYLHFYPL
uniref:Uncharacterized protein n=1 Tax=Tanacetum cinerariifolium TaxID=118510 RepID=A0A6L2JC06_TANCI|nr:hypothetical protein [Tanacetum cinerariifolium]